MSSAPYMQQNNQDFYFKKAFYQKFIQELVGNSEQVSQVIKINKYLLGTMAGGVADCQYLANHCRKYELKIETALDTTRDTHEECQQYLPNCTVVASGIGGCVALNDCNTYSSERQCKINSSGTLCGWNGSVCANRSCQTAPPTVTYSNDSACQDYMDGCTVVETGYGCESRKSECSDYKVSKQCIKTITNQLCYWNKELPIAICEIRTCFNAPSDSLSPALCEQHLNLCYSNMQYCRIENCEDLPYQTDFECKYFNSKCTTNGTNCVVRKKCQDVKNIAGCIMDDQFNDCEWYNEECVLKSCYTSPPYTTEQECNLYKQGCTTKLFGGCRQKTTCSEANVEQACIIQQIKICILFYFIYLLLIIMFIFFQ